MIDDNAPGSTESLGWTTLGEHSQVMESLIEPQDLKSHVTFADTTGITSTSDYWGKPTKQINRLGDIVDYGRTDHGLIETLTGPYRGIPDSQTPIVTYAYQGRHLLNKITYPDGTSDDWTYSSDRADQPATYLDRIGRLTEYNEYDTDSGYVKTETQKYGSDIVSVRRYTYEDGMIKTITTPKSGTNPADGVNVTTAMNYFPSSATNGRRGQLEEIVYPDATLRSFDYDTLGFLSQLTDEDGFTTSMVSDLLGRTLSTTLPTVNGHTPVYSYGWDLLGNPDWSSEPNSLGVSQTTDYQVDFMDRLATLILPDPDDAGPLPAPRYDFEYDANGYQTKMTDVALTEWHSKYDTYGRPEWMAQPADAGTFDSSTPRTTYVFDVLGRMESMTEPVEDQRSRTTHYAYDITTNQIVITDGESNATTQTFDAEGRPLSVVTADPDGGGSLAPLSVEYIYTDGITDSSGLYVGRRVTVKDPAGINTVHYFGPNDELVKTAYPDPVLNGPPGRLTMTWDFDDRGRTIAETRTTGSTSLTTDFQFDDRGNLTSVMTPDPDDGGPLQRLTTTYGTNAWGLPEFSQTPNGVRTEFGYYADASSQEVRTIASGGTLPDQVQTWVSYDNLGRVLQMQAADGGITAYSYDNVGNLITVQQPDPDTGSPTGPLTTYKHDIKGRVREVWDARNPTATGPQNRTVFDYDLADQLTRVTQPPTTTDATTPVTDYEYDLVGNLVLERDHYGNEVHYELDNVYRVTGIGQAAGGGAVDSRETFTWDDDGRMAAATDVLGRTTSYGYDRLGRVITVADHEGNMSQTDFDGFGRIIREILPDPGSGSATGPTTEYEYDNLDRVTMMTDPRGSMFDIEYYNTGQLKNEFDWRESGTTENSGRHTRYYYDDFGRIDHVRHGDWSNGNQNYEKTIYTYDSMNRVVSVDNRQSEPMTYAYDYLGRLGSQTDPLNGVTDYSYDAVGNLTSLTDPVGNTTTFLYDARDQLFEEQIDQDGSTLSRFYEYDYVGNLTSQTDRIGRERTFDWSFMYDGGTNYRLDNEKWFETGSLVRTIAVSYDPTTGLLVDSIEDPDSRIEYTYDALVRVDTVTQELDRATDVTFTLDYTYDRLSRRKKTEAFFENRPPGGGNPPPPSGGGGSDTDFVNEYLYNDTSQVTRIKQSGTGVSDKLVRMAWYADGTLENVRRFEDLQQSTLISRSDYTYDPDVDGRLISLVHEDQAGGTLADYTWTYTKVGQVETFDSSEGLREYTYDKTHQLTSVTLAGVQAESYEYDANGNRDSTGYVTDDNNRLDSMPLPDGGRYDFLYDNENNRESRKRYNAAGTLTEEFVYKWDHRNRLTEVQIYDDTGTETKRIVYTYDVYDRRISRQVGEADTSNPPPPRGGGPGGGSSTGGLVWQPTERYVYDSVPGSDLDHVVLTLDGGDFSVSERYLHGPIVDQFFAQEDEVGNVLWALADNQGTVRDLADYDGFSTTTVNHIEYDSFGNITSQSDPTLEPAFSYTGREWDADAELYYYRARYYDPVAGRFISEDPIGFSAGDANLSRMVGNGMPNATDPSGLQDSPPSWKGMTDRLGLSVAEFRRFSEIERRLRARVQISPDDASFHLGVLKRTNVNELMDLFLTVYPAPVPEEIREHNRRFSEREAERFKGSTAAEPGETSDEPLPASSEISADPEGNAVAAEQSVSSGELVWPTEYFANAFANIFVGDCAERDINGAGLFGSIVFGFTGLDVYKDVADIAYGFKNWQWTWSHAGGQALNFAALLPIFGTIKQAKYLDEIGDAAGGALKQLPPRGLGDLRPDEIRRIQAVVDEAGRPLEVVGSAARGERRGLGTDLPIGRKEIPGTRSDIDYAIPPSSADYFDAVGAGRKLPDVDSLAPTIHSPSLGPSIRFEPGKPPVFIPGTGG